MRKISILVAVLAVVAVMGVSAFAADGAASKAAPVKKMAAKAKMMTAKGTISAVDAKAGTLTVKEANGTETTFTVTAKMAGKLTAGEMVMVGYKTAADGSNTAVYVKKEMKKKEVKKTVKKPAVAK